MTSDGRIFAIREKSTGMFLPQAKTNFTWSVPCKANSRPLRLYHSRQAARISLHHWLRGVYDYTGSITSMTILKPENCGLPNRVREDMEVVELRLEVIPNE